MPDGNSLACRIRAALGGAAKVSAEGWLAINLHYELLQKWNPRVNLVGPSTLAGAAEKHYGESLFLAAHMPEGIQTVLDCGSGAGFPGFPFAVVNTNVQVTLLEADKRKAAFLRESCNLPNVKVRTERLEQLAERPDAVITRAVDPRFVMSWGSKHTSWFGFIGSTNDVETLREDPALRPIVAAKLPWNEQSSIIWAMFHVEHR